jgi:DNA-binding NarL/FixJ family response regulator
MVMTGATIHPATISVLVVDDHRAILAGVSALVDSDAPRMRVTGQARNSREALDIAKRICPHVIVLDIDLDGEDGLELIPLLRACCDAAIVVFSGLSDLNMRRRAASLGACNFIDKSAPGIELLDALRAALPSHP